MEQFKAALCYQNPTAYDCFELRKQLDAQARHLEHNTSLFHCEQQRRRAASQLSAQTIADMAKQLEIKESSLVTLSQENHELRSNLVHIREAVQLPKVRLSAGTTAQTALAEHVSLIWQVCSDLEDVTAQGTAITRSSKTSQRVFKLLCC